MNELNDINKKIEKNENKKSIIVVLNFFIIMISLIVIIILNSKNLHNLKLYLILIITEIIFFILELIYFKNKTDKLIKEKDDYYLNRYKKQP